MLQEYASGAAAPEAYFRAKISQKRSEIASVRIELEHARLHNLI